MAHVVLHLVHGTQFYLWRKPAIPWVEGEAEGSFRLAVRRQLEARGHRVEFDPIPWSGRNRHGARSAAARTILERVPREADGARHFLIAHSHGGNASLLALRAGGPQLQARLSGLACLATPFLVVRRASWAVAAMLAWLMVAFVGIGVWVQARVEGDLLAVGLSVLGMMPVGLSVLLLALRYKDRGRWVHAPDPCELPLLIVRCPGDEAISGLGFAEILARLVHALEHLAAWPIRMLMRHPVLLWLGGSALMIALVVSIVLLPGWEAWLGARWPWLLAILVGPLLVGLPLRLIVYGLAYGVDLFGLPLLASVSAEATPLGRWTSWLVEPVDAEERRLAHSEIYELPRVHGIVAGWVHERATAPRLG